MITRLATMSALGQAAAAETAAASGPNVVLIIIIVLVLLIVIVFLARPRKDEKAIESEDTKKPADDSKKSLPDDVNLENYEDKKEKLSLSEVKAAKRQTADEMSKEELRALRKERRAATQTEKAVKEREDEEEKDEVEESADVEEKGVKPESADEVKDSAAVQDEKKESGVSELIESPEASRETVADSEKAIASLFADDDDPFGSFEFGEGSSEASGTGTVFPTLGSALISLDQLNKAAEAEAEAEEEKDALDELTKRLMEKSEKKTLS